MSNYTHYCGPTNPIVNIETDVPAFSIAEREKHLIGEPITFNQAVLLCHKGKSRSNCVSEPTWY